MNSFSSPTGIAGKIRETLRRWRRLRLPKRLRGLKRAPIDPEVVALWGFVNAHIGIGASARGCARLLRQIVPRAQVHSIPLKGRDSVEFPSDPPCVRAGCNIIFLNPPELLAGNRLVPQNLLVDTRRIGYWAWELTNVPQRWKPAFDLVDEIWTCSTFSAAALRRETTKPVHVLPHVVPVRARSDRREARAVVFERTGVVLDDDVTFLCAFDYDSGWHRKNPLGAIEAFRRAFGPGPDGPRLVVKCLGVIPGSAEEAALLAAAADPRIQIIWTVLDETTLRALFDAVDCLVSLHRSEGFGLTLAEAMSIGLPVVCTAYSGNLDFTGPDDALMIPWSPIAVGAGGYVDFFDQTWADPDLDAAARAMRRVVEEPDEVARIAANGRERIARQLSEAAVAARMKALLERTAAPT